MATPLKLEFSQQYDAHQAQEYLLKHQDGLARRLSSRRDEHLVRKALAQAGEPGQVLDLPCGVGRYWPLLAEKGNRVIIGADNSAAMLGTATLAQPAEVVKRVRAFNRVTRSLCCYRLPRSKKNSGKPAFMSRDTWISFRSTPGGGSTYYARGKRMTVECASQMDAAPTDCFEHFWNQQGEWVEEPNQRRGGESGVQRILSSSGRLLYAKRQIGHIYRSWLHPFGRPTVLRERAAMQGLRLLEVGVPELVFCGARRGPQQQWQALLVTVALEGFVEIDNWYAAGERERHGEALHDRLLQEVASTLVRMHKGRWQHGCLYAKHVFVRVEGEGKQARVKVALLDFEKCRQRLSSQRAAAHDLKKLRRHSSWNDADWQRFYYFYKTAFGSPIKGL